MDKVSYALGIGIGRQLSQMGAAELNIDDFAQAIKDVIAGNLQNKRPNSRLQRLKRARLPRLKARNSSQRTARKRASSRQLRGCNTRYCAKETVKVRRLLIRLNAITKAL